jgi:hypothetical protein
MGNLFFSGRLDMKKVVLCLVFSIIIGCLALEGYSKIENYLIKEHRDFVYCRMLDKGMTYSEVTKILHKIGDYEDIPLNFHENDDYYHKITFKDPMTNYLIGGEKYIGFRNDELFDRYLKVPSDPYRFCGD